LRWTSGISCVRLVDELRAMVRRLRSPLLAQAGLTEALRQHINLFSERTTMETALQVTGKEERLEPQVEHALLRIVQEALTNIHEARRRAACDRRAGLRGGGGSLQRDG